MRARSGVTPGLTLDSIDLRIEPGQLVGVVGPVGSSKSSLLLALLTEIAPGSSGGAAGAALNGGGFVKVGVLVYCARNGCASRKGLGEEGGVGLRRSRYSAVPSRRYSRPRSG